MSILLSLHVCDKNKKYKIHRAFSRVNQQDVNYKYIISVYDYV